MSEANLTSSLAESARSLFSVIEAARRETASTRLVARSVVSALKQRGFFGLTIPRSLSGLEASPLDALEVYEEFAAADASVAWIVWNATLPGFVSRHLSAAARQSLFGRPGLLTVSSTRPSGRAVRSADGFRVDGRWTLVSGCELADPLLLRCVVPPTNGEKRPGPPELVMVYVPKSRCRVVDTWHAVGLRGTGSHDVVVEDTFIPGEHAVSFSDPVTLGTPLYRMPFAATLSAGAAAICLGLARRSIDVLVDLAGTRASLETGSLLRERPSALAAIARFEWRHAASRGRLRAVVKEAWETCEAGEQVSLRQRADVWSAAHCAALEGRDLVRNACDVAGTASLYEDCPLEPALRDVQAVTQHIILKESWLEDAGRVLVGSDPVMPIFAS